MSEPLATHQRELRERMKEHIQNQTPEERLESGLTVLLLEVNHSIVSDLKERAAKAIDAAEGRGRDDGKPLQDVVNGLLWMIDERVLVRNIDRDAESDYTVRVMKFTRKLLEFAAMRGEKP